jgi:hypothetical protein
MSTINRLQFEQTGSQPSQAYDMRNTIEDLSVTNYSNPNINYN